MPEKTYKHIEILEEGIIFANKIIITYSDDTIEEIETSNEKRDEFNECWDHLVAFAKQEGLTAKELLESDKVTKKEKELETEEVVVDEDKKVVAEEVTKAKKEEKKESKLKKNRWKICIGAGAVAVLLGTGYVLVNHFNNNQNNNSNNAFVQIVDKTKEDEKTYEEKLVEISTKNSEINNILTRMVNGKLNSYEELEQSLSYIGNASLANITEISCFINDTSTNISGTKATINMRSPFKKDTVDYYAVDYFNGLRDNVIKTAYEEKNRDNTKTCVNKFNESFVKFVFGGETLPCTISGNKVRFAFDDLSPSAKMTIVTMGMTMLNVEQEFKINVNGEEYNRIFTLTEAYELSQTIYQELAKEQSFSKTK